MLSKKHRLPYIQRGTPQSSGAAHREAERIRREVSEVQRKLQFSKEQQRALVTEEVFQEWRSAALRFLYLAEARMTELNQWLTMYNIVENALRGERAEATRARIKSGDDLADDQLWDALDRLLTGIDENGHLLSRSPQKLHIWNQVRLRLGMPPNEPKQ